MRFYFKDRLIRKGTWRIFKSRLIDARLYFISIFVGLFTGLIAVPYHYLLILFFNWRHDFFVSKPDWFWYIPLFLILWGILIFVSWLVKKMPLITGGGIHQTRAVINGRVTFKKPLKELAAKFAGGVLALSSGLSLGREGPSVQIGSYVGFLISKWTKILSGQRKQLISAGAGAGLAAAFAAPLSSSLLVIESIERFNAPKTAIATLLAGVVAGGVATWLFPLNLYSHISATVPDMDFETMALLFIIISVIVSLFGKLYSYTSLKFKRIYPTIKMSGYMKLFYLLVIAFIISMVEVDLTGGGEHFLIDQAVNPNTYILWVVAMMLIHFVFSALSFASGLPGGSFVTTLVTGGLLGQIIALVMVRMGLIGHENISYIMLICMSAFLVAVIRTPLTAIVLITEMTGHFGVFYATVVVGGITYYLTEMLRIEPFNKILYEDMINSPNFQEDLRHALPLEVMSGSYLDGKVVADLQLPAHCVITSIQRDLKDYPPAGMTLMPGDQVQVEIDSQDIEKLYEPLVSMANID